jgi:peptide/nickel transport system substrate-binding protein
LKVRKKRVLWSILALLMIASVLASACGQNTVEVTRVVTEKETVVQKETVVETVMETVIVEGTPEVIEKEATRVVEVEKPVEVVITATPDPSAGSPQLGRELIGEYEGPTIITDPAQFPTEFHEAPELAALVAEGELPPVEERLPVREDLMVYEPLEEVGTYGGVWKGGYTGPADWWNAYRISGTDYPLYRDPSFTEVVPNVLKDVEISEDGQVFDLYLREGMRWSDGAPFTADDWLFWYEDMLNEPAFNISDAGFSPNGEPGVMEKIDDYHIRITFSVPYAFFKQLLSSSYGHTQASGRAGLYHPKHYLSQFHAKYIGEEEANRRAAEEGYENWVLWFQAKGSTRANLELPVITPWVQVTDNTASVWVFERNPYYWQVDTAGNQLPYIDRIELTLVANAEVINIRAIAGEFDFQEQYLDLKNLPIFLETAADRGYKVYLDPGDYGSEVQFRPNQNYDVDPYIGELLRNVDFRRALSLGINRDEINDVIFLGMGVVGSPIPAPHNPYYPGDEYRTLWHTYEPEQANAMLDSLGLDQRDSEGFRLRTDNGQRLVLSTVIVDQGSHFYGVAEMVRDQWRDIGIYLDVSVMDRVLADEYEKTGEIMLYCWNNDGSDTLFLPSRAKKVLPIDRVSVIARHWGEWYQTRGESGEEPPERIKEGLEMLRRGPFVSEEERFRLGQEIWKIHVDEVIAIGTVGLVPQFVAVRVVNENMRNVPERLYNSPLSKHPSIGRPQTWFFNE